MITKRILFVFTVTCLLTLLAPTGWAQTSAEPETAASAEQQSEPTSVRTLREQQKKALAGTWQVVVTPTNPPPGFPLEFPALHSYTEDGRFIGITGTNIPLVNSPTLGEWRHEGGRRFNVTFLYYIFDPAGNLALTVYVRTRLTLNERGDEFSGPTKFDARTPDGNLFLSGGTGTQRAKRVRVVPF